MNIKGEYMTGTLEQGVILSTNQYDLFSFFRNRTLLNQRGRSFLKLKESIKLFGLLQPIIVDYINGRYVVVDGQHRLLACKALTIPVKVLYAKGSYAALISLNNDRVNWQIGDYVNHFITSTDVEVQSSYSKIKQLNLTTKLSYNALHAMLKGKEIDPAVFKTGGFRISREDEIKFKDAFEKISNLLDSKNGEHRSKLLKTRVIYMLSLLVRHGKYRPTVFYNKLDNNSFPSVNTLASAKMELLKLYNKNLKTKDRILDLV
jgi:hypothetical protein